ncbi:MAG: VWA domain-containing protein [Rhodospirillales bacterium]|nr:VWA domain-containing protein [Rhodospirillales bacterium]
MLVRPRQALDALSISALDLFASALGAFMLLAVSFFPYYLRAPALEEETEGARAELAAAAQALREAETANADANQAQGEAFDAAAQARQRLERARAALAAQPAPTPTVVETPSQAATPVPGPRRSLLAITDLDLVFVMDTTGSMRDELQDLQANLVAIIQVLQRLAPTLRIGFVAYRDRGDAYVVRGTQLAALDAANADVLSFVRRLSAEGGGDEPERVDEALAAATSMPWRNDAQGRIIVIGDAPAHPADIERTLSMAARFRLSAPNGRFPRAVAAIYTGASLGPTPARRFFERLAEAGGGEFSVHKGQMIESVLLAVLAKPHAAGGSR